MKPGKKETILYAGIMALLLFNAVSGNAQIANTISAADKVYGLSKFWQEVNYNFVYLNKVDRKVWDSTYKALIPQVQATANDYEYYRLLQKFCALLNDGHTNIYQPKIEGLQIIQNMFGDHLVVVKRIDGKAIIIRSWKKDQSVLPAGSEIVEVNVLSDIYAKEDLAIEKNRGKRVLSDEEITMVWKAIDESKALLKNKIFLKLCLMYGCRNGELRKALKSDFDLKRKVWIVPVENNKVGKKTGREIVRPILPEMEELIVEAMSLNDSEYFLTNDDDVTPMGHGSSNSLAANVM